jgi:HSP20 family protein
MGKARKNPFRGFVDTISEMNRMKEHWMTGYEAGQEGRQRTHATAWVPTTDIFARGRDLIVRIELAGVSREDVDITLSGGVLTISGERKGEPSEDEVSYYVQERFYGTFRRSMTLPEGIDRSKITASFDNGMLEVTVEGGASTAEPQQIQIEEETS